MEHACQDGEQSHTTSVQETINVEASISDSAALIPQTRRGNSCVTFVLVFLLLTLLVVGIFSGLYAILSEEKGLDVLDNVFYVTRDEWGAIAANNATMKSLKLPIYRILLVDTDGPECSSNESCSELMRQMQLEHVVIFNNPDVDYNFVIGGDGRTYEGRGWKYASHMPNYFDERTLIIGISGDFEDKYPAKEHIKQLKGLLDLAIDESKLIPCYTVLSKKKSNKNPSYMANVAAELQTTNAFC